MPVLAADIPIRIGDLLLLLLLLVLVPLVALVFELFELEPQPAITPATATGSSRVNASLLPISSPLKNELPWEIYSGID
jgi:hypothetical protein